MSRWLFVIGLGALSAACGSSNPIRAIGEDKDIAAAEETIKDTLADPDSAEFKDVHKLTAAVSIVCGKVNMKNKFGGYIGYSPFFVNLAAGTNGILLLDDTDASVGAALMTFPDECLPEPFRGLRAQMDREDQSKSEDVSPTEAAPAESASPSHDATPPAEPGEAPIDLLPSDRSKDDSAL